MPRAEADRRSRHRPRYLLNHDADADTGSFGDGTIAFLVGALSAVQLWPLPFNVAIVDVVIVLVEVYAVGYSLRGGGSSFRLKHSPIPWLWLILVGSVLGTLAASSATNSMLQILRDGYAFSIFFAVGFWLCRKPGTWHVMAAGVLTVAAVCAVTILAEGGRRPAGTFANPNYAGHFMASALILLLLVRTRVSRWWLLLTPLLAAAIVYTASFGALTMIGAALCAWLWFACSTRTAATKVILRVLIVAVAALIINSGVFLAASESDQASADNLGASRFDHSTETRAAIWRSSLALVPDHPFGVGPGAVRDEDLALRGHEVHSDPIAYLVERGSIGLIGLIGFAVALWRSSPPRGAGRVLLVAFAVGSLTRETLDYRHLWIILALAFIYDQAPDRKRWRLSRSDRGVSGLASVAEERVASDGSTSTSRKTTNAASRTAQW